MAAAAGPMSVTRRVRFAAARRVWSEALDEAGNRALYGDATELHGRDFSLHVTLRGPVPDSTGMVMDLKALSRLLDQQVVSRLDHHRLDGAEILAGRPASTENLAVAIWRRLEPRLEPGSLSEVRLTEGEDRTVVYRGE